MWSVLLFNHGWHHWTSYVCFLQNIILFWITYSYNWHIYVAKPHQSTLYLLSSFSWLQRHHAPVLKYHCHHCRYSWPCSQKQIRRAHSGTLTLISNQTGGSQFVIFHLMKCCMKARRNGRKRTSGHDYFSCSRGICLHINATEVSIKKISCFECFFLILFFPHCY